MTTAAQAFVLILALALVAGILTIGAVLVRLGAGPDRDLREPWDPRVEWSFRAKSRERAAVAVAIGVLLTLFLLTAVTPGPMPR